MQARSQPAEITSEKDLTDALANVIELAHRAGLLWVQPSEGSWLLVPQCRFPIFEAGTPVQEAGN